MNMANYGFGENNESWNESRKNALAKSLTELIKDMEGEGKFIGLKEGQKPYVEVDVLYKGVTIRKMTYLEKKVQIELIERANKRYLGIMILDVDANYLPKNA
jgi:hypothetical protein